MTEKTIFLQVASFLMDEYTYKLGEHELALALSTQRHYLRYLLHDAQRKYGADDKYKAFFACLAPGAQSWLSAAEQNIERAVTTACALAGTTVSTSQTPVHREHVSKLARANVRFHYLNRGGDGVLKRLVMVLMWSAVGRTAEVATLCFDLCEWDPHYDCVSIWWFQPKTSKFKKVVLFAGREVCTCPFDAFADAFATGVYTDVMMNEEKETAWVVKRLAVLKDPGAAIGAWVADLGKGSRNKALEFVHPCTTSVSLHARSSPPPSPPPRAGPSSSSCPRARTRRASASAAARSCAASSAKTWAPPCRGTGTRLFPGRASSSRTPSSTSRT